MSPESALVIHRVDSNATGVASFLEDINSPSAAMLSIIDEGSESIGPKVLSHEEGGEEIATATWGKKLNSLVGSVRNPCSGEGFDANCGNWHIECKRDVPAEERDVEESRVKQEAEVMKNDDVKSSTREAPSSGEAAPIDDGIKVTGGYDDGIKVTGMDAPSPSVEEPTETAQSEVTVAAPEAIDKSSNTEAKALSLKEECTGDAESEMAVATPEAVEKSSTTEKAKVVDTPAEKEESKADTETTEKELPKENVNTPEKEVSDKYADETWVTQMTDQAHGMCTAFSNLVFSPSPTGPTGKEEEVQAKDLTAVALNGSLEDASIAKSAIEQVKEEEQNEQFSIVDDIKIQSNKAWTSVQNSWSFLSGKLNNLIKTPKTEASEEKKAASSEGASNEGGSSEAKAILTDLPTEANAPKTPKTASSIKTEPPAENEVSSVQNKGVSNAVSNEGASSEAMAVKTDLPTEANAPKTPKTACSIKTEPPAENEVSSTKVKEEPPAEAPASVPDNAAPSSLKGETKKPQFSFIKSLSNVGNQVKKPQYSFFKP